MNDDFVITSVNAVLVFKSSGEESVVEEFSAKLSSNELIYHFIADSMVEFNDKSLYCGDNTLRFLPKGENHKYIVCGKKESECIDVYFDTDIPVSNEAFVMKINEKQQTLRPIFRKMLSVWTKKEEGYRFKTMSLIYDVFSELCRQEYLPDSGYEKIRPAVEFINDCFLTGEISVDYLAKICGISQTYLKTLFLKRFGVSPKKYIIEKKIDYAADILRTGQYSVTATASMCNYDDVYYFSRQFKNYNGVSPSVYAKIHYEK